MKTVTFKITNENYYRMLFICKLAGFDVKDFLNEHLNHADFDAIRGSDLFDFNQEYQDFKKKLKNV